ncbi:RNA polymerase sigma factor [Cellulomonas composti]|uniref:DNA-directed RNA polymerase sigma-70 factor n=1 Tax=Cellulomonas composti TaxID=266130 RepID=A0A511J7W5_9CELL|nr:RNA polymerase sigma factor [Cellulomonas composti]GEL94097.1 DNA-directed RNA polymerase sigma-70 factor [Cellulomonas composti]
MGIEQGDGDAQRFAAMWERYAPRIQAYASRHVGRDDAQEIVAETFLVAWRRLSVVPGEPLPWLLVVARNTVANHRRSQHRARLVSDELARLRDVAAPGPAADGVVEERDALLRALATLTAAEREALLLVAWDGLAPAQAAQVAGCSVTAFKVRLHRARKHLDVGRPADAAPRDGRLALAPQEG